MRRALATALLVLAATLPRALRAEDGSEPLPIPGGFHFFAPGPPRLGYRGLDVEASTISNFSGDVALAYLVGRARSAAGESFLLGADMRVFRGDYAAADGVTRRGAFGFV